MYKGKRFLAVIPARGGSKGIPRKNIKNINGRPLLQYTVDEAKNAKLLDRIIVSTDDEEIAKVAVQCGAEVPSLRPRELAGDGSKTIDVLMHVLREMENMSDKYDYLVLLQPTQPLRKGWHIDEAIEKIVDKNEESLVSVSMVKESPVLIRTINEDGSLKNLLNINSTIRRQDFPKYYKVNGAIYINRINNNLNKNTSLNDNKIAYIMERDYDLDIDEEIDIEVFKLLLAREKEV